MLFWPRNSGGAHACCCEEEETPVCENPCGINPPTLTLTSSEGWELELVRMPPAGLIGTHYTASRLVPLLGAKWNGSACSASPLQDIECRITYTLYCFSDTLQFAATHATKNNGGQWLHYADVEKPSTDPTRCVLGTTGSVATGLRGFAATLGNGLLACDPFEIEGTCDFDFSGIGPSGHGTFAATYVVFNEETEENEIVESIMASGIVTFTITE